MINYLKSVLEGKKVLILGFGREGRSSLNIIKKYIHGAYVAVADSDIELKNDPHLREFDDDNLFLGNDYLNSISKFDIVLKSPGVNLKNSDIAKDLKISSQTALFLDYYHQQTIGVSGTKGKSTTASLIYFLLNKNKKKCVLLGNIGKPAFDFIGKIDNETIVVYELSAHQLENIDRSPKTAVLLNVFPEHLDYFKDFELYQKAKFNLFRSQDKNDFLVVSEGVDIGNSYRGNKITYGISNANMAYLKQNDIVIIEDGKQYSFNCDNLKIKGNHNYQNALAAILAVKTYGVSIENSFAFVNDFKPLAHRLEFVDDVGGIKFYNDSISTIPESTIEAIKTLGNVDTLLLGGFDRGIEYSHLAEFLCKQQICTYIFFGKAGIRIKELMQQRGEDNSKFNFSENMYQAFKIIEEKTKNGGICLLSPAASSYDHYKNFEHRGDAFKELVNNLKRK